MKVGYSILLGEIIEASKLQYHDCERFQVVCPSCREPVFKATRTAGVNTPTHYLSHYEASAAYVDDCDLRADGTIKNGYEPQNTLARNQRLQYFLAVLRRTVGMGPLYTAVEIEKAHYRLDRSPALAFLKEAVWQSSILPNRETLFAEGVDDYLYRVMSSGWAVTTTFSLDMQKRIARDMWYTITTPSGKSNYEFLFNHAFLVERNGFLVGLQQQSGIEAAVSGQIVAYMDALVTTTKSSMKGLLQEMAETQLPAQFNVIHGQHDDEDCSTYLTRIVANLAVEMVGTLMTLPYFELLKKQYGDPSKVYPYRPGTEPVDPEEKERIEALVKQAKDRDGSRAH